MDTKYGIRVILLSTIKIKIQNKSKTQYLQNRNTLKTKELIISARYVSNNTWINTR